MQQGRTGASFDFYDDDYFLFVFFCLGFIIDLSFRLCLVIRKYREKKNMFKRKWFFRFVQSHENRAGASVNFF